MCCDTLFEKHWYKILVLASKHKHELVFAFSNTDKSNLSNDREVLKAFSAFAAIFFRLG
jgi:hypothetical protein